MQISTLDDVQNGFEAIAVKQAKCMDIQQARAEIVELIQRAKDVSVLPENEICKRDIVRTLQWMIDMIDSDMVQQ
jgi:hypothetical protein